MGRPHGPDQNISRAADRSGTRPTAGVSAKAPSKQTNRYKPSGKRGMEACRDLHGRNPSSGSRHKVLGESSLEDLYHTLLHLFTDESDHLSQLGSLSLENQYLDDIHDIADLLFDELERQLGWFMPDGYLLSPTKIVALPAHVKHGLHIDIKPSPGYLVLLLRCCMILLHPLGFKYPTSTSEKCQVLIRLLKKLCFLDHVMQHPHQCTCGDSSTCMCSSMENGRIVSLRCLLLEVFLDQLLLNQNIKKVLMDADNVFGINKDGAPHGRLSGMPTILDIISAHFTLSVNEDFGKFLFSILSSHESGPEIPQLCLTAVVRLLRTAVICSVPPMLQAHLILLASKTVGIYISPTNVVPSKMLLHNYIAAFDQSTDLYRYLMLSLQLGVNQSEDFSTSSYSLEHFLNLSTNSYLKSATYGEMNSHAPKLEVYDNFPSNMSCKGNELKDAMAFVKENIHIIKESFRHEAFLFLKSILAMPISSEREDDNKPGINWRDIYRIAALLKLMSSLLLKVVWGFKNHGILDGINYAKKQFFQREFKFLHGTIYSFICRFGNRMFLNVAFKKLEANSASYDGIHLVLIHFVGLLLHSLQHGYVHFWMGCILMILSLLNFLSFEVGNLDLLKPLLSHIEKSFDPFVTPSKMKQGKSCRRSSFVIASNFQKIQDLCSQNVTDVLTFEYKGIHAERSIMREEKSKILTSDQEDMDSNIHEIGRHNSENYLYLTGCTHTDIDDLANFIDCTKIKDYTTLLMNRRKFRKWKSKKIAVARRQERFKRRWMLVNASKDTHHKAL